MPLMPSQIIAAIESSRINLSTEALAQNALTKLFDARGWPAQAEVRLTPSDRIDFMIQDVGLEVKIGQPRRSILRQLERYAACEEVGHLILVTSTAFPSGGFKVGGKQVDIAKLSVGWL